MNSSSCSFLSDSYWSFLLSACSCYPVSLSWIFSLIVLFSDLLNCSKPTCSLRYTLPSNVINGSSVLCVGAGEYLLMSYIQDKLRYEELDSTRVWLLSMNTYQHKWPVADRRKHPEWLTQGWTTIIMKDPQKGAV